ncbi:FAD-binding oxidoreductase [Pseudoalteromonas denitrificans]|uniref:4-cresol dehydrogenase (Hydroxylating) n=1 Tax=Pseudoalteromonas denitrificans DSM 6059 TaxID=1123010 RepID=A0A1I1M6N9_9GAMM|nr:FAD-binding oxidoreductase [Pseudoalteromonas denitrificans]SFC78243.1 4-cresol dehydrogenase (hydroxylating) [Pseudoalteromonas denitrificans DSM 6059]
MEIFLSDLANLFGQQIIVEQADVTAYNKNVSGYDGKIEVVLLPDKKEQIQEIVKLANKYGIALYPISGGKNWGLGSRLPVKSDCIIVDLSKLRTISEVNEEFGYAIIEPGVTQIQLADYLKEKQSNYFLDVTGSGKETSVLGNCLERGTGYNALKADLLLNIEAVLGTGEVLKTGFWHYENSKVTHIFKHGIGPDLTGTLVQSNFSIVTSIAIQLLPVPKVQTSFSVRVTDDNLLEFIEKLSELRQLKVVNSIVHIVNNQRSKISLTPIVYDLMKADNPNLDSVVLRDKANTVVGANLKKGWGAVGNLMGTPQQVKYAKKMIKSFLGPLGKVDFIDEKKLNRLEVVLRKLRLKKTWYFIMAYKRVYGMMKGAPQNESLRSIYWPNAEEDENWENPDLGKTGLVFFAPVIPCSAVDVKKALDIVNNIANRYQYNVALTLNTLSDKVLEVVIGVDFNLDLEKEKKKAHEFSEELIKQYKAEGFYPYRLGIKDMPVMLDQNDPYWLVIKEMKKVFDPNNVISPGRYNLI